MDFSKVINELNNASLFELYRLDSAIWDQLEKPERIKPIRDCLQKGQTINYFDRTQNRLIDADIIELKRTRALVKNKQDGKFWTIPYYFVNVDNTEVAIRSSAKKLDKTHLKVGDKVCFKDKTGNDLFGEICKLNPKTAGVLVGQMKWRVPYNLLSPIIDGETGTDIELIEKAHP